ncbi:hypothetical protein BU15DRAFT_83661 [Melanogaster broomeanus]|nr:hypothetical protein BU15DRAFT_83661 [Melanogaster broomeanus]
MPSCNSRKFVDLILTASSKWANWDPPKSINVGDYGTISKETGEFEREGNIYSEDFQRLLDEWSANIDVREATLQPVVSARDDQLIISSAGAHAKQAQIAADVNVQSLANAGLHVNFGFSEKGGAVLVLYKPEHYSFPTVDGRLARLLKTAHKAVKDKFIVTEVVSCPAYFMAMSREKCESYSASLSATVTPPIPVATVGATASLAGSYNTFNGIYRSGSNAIFVPLYKLSQPRRSFWSFLKFPGHRGIGSGDEPFEWESVRPPWDKLDDDGEEVERYDPTMHSDEESDWEVECEQ